MTSSMVRPPVSGMRESAARSGGPSSTETLPPWTVTVTVRSGGMSQRRSVQTASAMARLCAASLGCGGAVCETCAVAKVMGGASCC